jgi:hypothetical protein
MLASGNALAGGNIHRAGTDCLRIIGQPDSLVCTRTETIPRIHVLKRISIGIVIPYCLNAGCIEIAGDAIPRARNKWPCYRRVSRSAFAAFRSTVSNPSVNRS